MPEFTPFGARLLGRAALVAVALAPVTAAGAPEAVAAPVTAPEDPLAPDPAPDPAPAEAPAPATRPQGPDPAPTPGPAPPSDAPEVETQPIRWWDPDVPIRAQWSRPQPADRTPVRPIYLAEDEFSASRRPPVLDPAEGRSLRFRGVTVGVAAQVVFGRVSNCSYDDDTCVETKSSVAAEAMPTFDLLAEFGGRRLRLVFGIYSSPRWIGFSHAFYAIFVGARVGLLIGNEKIRAGVTGSGGLYGWEVNGHLFVTPWRGRRGGRHGLALGVGAWLVWPSVTIGYRFAPAAWNHRGGRRAAIRRARARAEAGSTAMR